MTTALDAYGRSIAVHSRHRRRPDRTVACASRDHEHCPVDSHRCDCSCHEGDWICCEDATLCNSCGDFVCAEHSAEVASCVEIGIHHLICVTDCSDCRRAHAQDVADDLASGYANERGR